MIETVVPFLGQADDSNGELGGVIEEAFQLLAQLMDKVSGKFKEEFFDYLITESQKKIYKDWCFCWDFLSIAADITDFTGEQKKLFSALDFLSEDNSRYCLEKAVEIKWKVIQKIGDKKGQIQFLEKNLKLPTIRKSAIYFYRQQKNLQKAEKLATEGLRLTSEYPGLALDFQKQLLEIAKEQKDKVKIREITELLFFETSDLVYYSDLQKYWGTQWEQEKLIFLKRVQKEVVKRCGRFGIYTLAEIYAREGMRIELLRLIQKVSRESLRTSSDGSAVASCLKKYEKILKPDYANELAECYREIIEKELKAVWTDRKLYREICRYLRRMKKLGKGEMVSELIIKLRNLYPRRKALLEELGNV